MVLKRHTTAAEADASMPADHGEGQPPAFEAQDVSSHRGISPRLGPTSFRTLLAQARDHKASDDKVFDTPAADAKAHELQATVESGTMASGHHADQASEETGPTASEHHKPREGFLASFLRRIYTVADNLVSNSSLTLRVWH